MSYPINDEKFCCPVCDFDYVHIEKIEVHPVDDKTITISMSGLNVSKEKSIEPLIQNQRGTVIIITYNCEEGHRWEYKQQFHKGMTFHEINRLDDCKRDEQGFLELRPTLWRD